MVVVPRVTIAKQIGFFAVSSASTAPVSIAGSGNGRPAARRGSGTARNALARLSAQLSGTARPNTRLARLVCLTFERTKKRLICTSSAKRRVRVRPSHPSQDSRVASFRAARVHTTIANT